jgi:hypothetical protein
MPPVVSPPPRVRMLIPLWGGAYVRRFARFALPSLLASGNLAALAAVTDLDVVLLTPAADLRELDAGPAMARLRATATTRHLAIDDLAAGNRAGAPFYGLTLTRAYWRGIADMGDAMTDTRFVLMNADFVVADGSLRSLAARILAGERLVLASNLRCVAEDMEQPLAARLDDSGTVLTMAPRDMVALALQHQHPLQLAKIVNAAICHTTHPNQFFWQVDETAMVSRHYLYFPLCIHPQRAPATVEGYCDYAFAPELCPTAETTAMEDSDAFCMFELQSRGSELELLRMGAATLDEAAASLSSWTTRGQRAAALRHQVVFRTGPLTPAIEQTAQQAKAFLVELDRRLSPEPVDHREHPYWVSATTARGERPLPRLTPAGEGAVARNEAAAGKCAVWRPHWLDFRPVTALADEARRAGAGHVLYICDPAAGPAAGRFAAELADARTADLNEAVSGHMETRLPPQGDHRLIVVEITRHHYAALRGLESLLRPYLAPGGKIAFHLFEPTAWRSGVALAYDMRRLIGFLGAAAPQRCTLILAGGETRRRNAQLWFRLDEIRRRHPRLSAPLLAPLRLLLAILTAAANRAAVPAQDARRPVRDVSSFTLIIEAPPTCSESGWSEARGGTQG